MKLKGVFDSHAHYDGEEFKDDRDTVLKSLFEQGVYAVCNISADPNSIEKSYRLTQKYKRVYMASGIHPQYSEYIQKKDLQTVIEYAKKKKTVAIGEIGLDYHFNCSKKKQADLFEAQMEIAKDLKKPVVIHSRDAIEDTLNIIKKYKDVTGVVHCFSSSLETAKQLVKLGYKIGITGVVTFKNARRIKEVAANIPLSYILAETDCPYLAPDPFRGKRCDSTMLDYTIAQIAELKGVEAEKVADKTRQNAIELYKTFD